ncbi:hypothetical protein ASD64_19065 [Mesorhizobium sp. Root157]|nr:hypothetical protein ASD64_19065 [Mesorhizobium sp. Root157]
MRGGAQRASTDVGNPKKHSDWRAIIGLQARIAALFIPVVVALAILATFAGTERNPRANGIDPTMTSSVR